MARSTIYIVDGLGSITALVDQSGNVVQTYRYDSFGNILSSTGSLTQPYTYTGREFDQETGLFYYRHRYYDAKIGRFLQEDPIGFIGGDNNLYAYVFSNPTNLIDPSGLFGDGRTYGPDSDKHSQWLGHSDFYGHQWFDYTWEDHDLLTSPFNPVTGTANHFQDFNTSLNQAKNAICNGNLEDFERSMHRLQDYFSHYGKGYRWDPLDRHFGHLFAISSPDNDNIAWARANRTTKALVKEWIRINGIPLYSKN